MNETELERLNKEIIDAKQALTNITSEITSINQQREVLIKEKENLRNKLEELEEARAKIFNS